MWNVLSRTLLLSETRSQRCSLCRIFSEVDSNGRSATRRALQEQLRAARAEYEQTSYRLRKLNADILTGTPSADRVWQIRHTGAEHASALSRYMEALSALNDFELFGILPDGFRP